MSFGKTVSNSDVIEFRFSSGISIPGGATPICIIQQKDTANIYSMSKCLLH